MTEDDLFGSLAPEILRDRWGRPMIIPPDGGKPEPYTRVSTFAKTLSDAGGLIQYKSRYTALGIGRYEDLAAIAAGCEYGDPKLDEVIETAQDRVGGSAKANYGIAIHRFTEPDAPNHVPARMVDDIEAYRTELARHRASVLVSERFIVNDALKVAGTFDDILRFSLIGNRMADKKSSLKPLENAIQIAAYAGGVYYELDVDGNPVRTPLPDVDQDTGIIAHIPAGEGRCVFYAVDLNLGRAACEIAIEVRGWRRRKDLATELEPPKTFYTGHPADHAPKVNTTADPLAPIRLAIKSATTPARLAMIWELNKAVWNDELTALAAERKNTITGHGAA